MQHALLHGSVVCQAAAEVEVLKVLCAHAGGLGHAGCGPGEDGPFAAVAGDIAGGLEVAAHNLHTLAGHICGFEAVVIGIEADMHLHVLCALQAVAAVQLVLLICGAEGQFLGDGGV